MCDPVKREAQWWYLSPGRETAEVSEFAHEKESDGGLRRRSIPSEAAASQGWMVQPLNAGAIEFGSIRALEICPRKTMLAFVAVTVISQSARWQHVLVAAGRQRVFPFRVPEPGLRRECG